MGRRLESLDLPLPPGLRGQICAKFRQLVKASSVTAVAEKSGLSAGYVSQIIAGRSTPDMDRWPELAARLGMSDWTELFDSGKAVRGTAPIAKAVRGTARDKKAVRELAAVLSYFQSQIND